MLGTGPVAEAQTCGADLTLEYQSGSNIGVVLGGFVKTTLTLENNQGIPNTFEELGFSSACNSLDGPPPTFPCIDSDPVLPLISKLELGSIIELADGPVGGCPVEDTKVRLLLPGLGETITFQFINATTELPEDLVLPVGAACQLTFDVTVTNLPTNVGPPPFTHQLAHAQGFCPSIGSGSENTGSGVVTWSNLVVDLELAKFCEPGLNPQTGDFDYTLTITNPVNPLGATLENCVISDPGATCDGQVIAGPIPADGSSVPVNCSSPSSSNTATVTCEIVENPGQFVDATASATCDDDVEIDKQVSCDSGGTWNDVGFNDGVIEGCTGWSGAEVSDEIKFRYRARNTGGGALTGCELTDSNGVVIAGSENVGDLAVGEERDIFMTSLLSCDEVLVGGEPDTATLTCTGTTGQVSDTDTATIEACLEPGLSVAKVCADGQFAPNGDFIYTVAVTNTGDAPLANCVVTDPTATCDVTSITSLPVGGAPATFGCASALGANTVTVECEIVGSGQPADPCDDLSLSDDTVLDTQSHSTCGTLDAGPMYAVIGPAGDLTLTAGTAVVLNNGFSVGVDGTFSAGTDTALFREPKTISAQGSDTCEACPVVEVDKQVSCDGGATWHDMLGFDDASGDSVLGCTGWTTGEPEVKVRYFANSVLGAPQNCILTDTNTAILPGSINAGSSPNGQIHIVDVVTCDETQAGWMEPNTATLTCDQCVLDPGQPGIPVEDSDTASIDCQTPNVDVAKECASNNGDGTYTYNVKVTNPEPQFGSGAVLDNCRLDDQMAVCGPLSQTLLQVGQTATAECTGDQNMNMVTVTCDIVGSGPPGGPPKTVSDESMDGCVDVDKQISCDSGVTFVDVGYNDSIAASCIGWTGTGPDAQEIVLRYRVRTGSAMTQCSIVDSNPAIPPVPPIGALPSKFDDFVFTTPLPPSALTCDEVDPGEPDQATLTCVSVESGATVTDTDDADLECQLPDLEVVKVCEAGPEVCEDCGCESKVTVLTLEYTGSAGAQVIVEMRKDGTELFNDTVQPGEQFTLLGIDMNGTLGPEINVFVDGQFHTAIHTSCSQPIGPGLQFGDFLVIDGRSRSFDGPLCPFGDPSGQVCEPGEFSITISVTNPANPDGASLANCVVDDLLDEAAGCDTTIPTLEPGDSETITCTAAGLTATTLNEVEVTCDIVGSVDPATGQPKMIMESAQDVCEVQEQADLRVSKVCSSAFFDFCPRTPGFWKNHLSDWPVDSLVLGGIDYDANELLAFLRYGGPDASLKLARHLVATKFNLLSGSDPLIQPAVDAADAFLAIHPPGSDPQGAAKDEALAIKDLLDIYNNTDCQFGQHPTTSASQVTITVENPSGSNVTLTDCVVTDILAPDCNTTITTLVPGQIETIACSAPGLVATTLNEVSVTCNVENTPETITRTAEDVCEVDVCEVIVDKQVDCGNGFIDIGKVDESCSAVTGQPVTIRWLASAGPSNTVDLVECVLTDSNGVALGAPFIVGSPIDPSTVDLELTRTTEECSALLAGGEPDMARLVCQCADQPDPAFTVEDRDWAEFGCGVPDLRVVKECLEQDSSTGINAVTIRVENPSDVPLANCLVSDPLAPDCDAVIQVLAPGAVETVSCSVLGLMDDTLNEVSVTCDVEGTNEQISRSDDDLCEVPDGEDCGCKSKVTELTLEYTGAASAQVRVEQKNDGVEVFNGTVQPGEQFTLFGMDKNGTLSTEIKIFVNGQLHTMIHTSCSQPIGPGLVFGNFLVIGGTSRSFDGPLCPLGQVP
ncbi:MAG: hypothetical protein IH936_06825 [Acidobacteria bacterium]|nr:hypothetical protein [Acidobacteriota bacterium]